MASSTASPPTEATTTSDALRMTYDEYVAWYDKEAGRRGEWVDGEVIVFMAISERHARTVDFLIMLLGNYLDLRRIGRLFSQGFELRSREEAAREPDILVVLNEHKDRIEHMRLRGAADLVIEVISPDSVTRDRRDKQAEYAAAGVPEYWLVDPREHKERFDILVLDPEGYYLPVVADEDGCLHSTVLPGVWVDPSWLLMDELPSVVRLGLEMAGVETPSVQT